MIRMLTLSIFLLFSASSQSSTEEENPYVNYRVETYNLQQQYLEEVSTHQKQIMRDMEIKLRQQRWQTNAIAFMVFIMVGTGLYLSFMQFRADRDSGKRSSFSFKVGAGSFEINSSVIGLAILAMSFWFFQTYIDRVYSIEVFNMPPIDMTTFGVNR